MTTNTRPQAGDRIHFLADGFSFTISDAFHGARISRRGQTVTITQQMIDASEDREGNSWLDLVDDEGEQIERWGQIMFGRGAWPESEPLFVWGSPEWADARAAAKKLAHAIIAPQEKRAALAKVEADFGPSKPTSKTLRDYDRGRERGDEILRRATTAELDVPETSRQAEAREVLLHEADLIRRQRAHTKEPGGLIKRDQRADTGEEV